MKKALKRIAALVLAVVLIAGTFAACSGSKEETGAQIGLLYCSAEANSKYQVEKVSEELVKYSVQYWRFDTSLYPQVETRPYVMEN